MIHRGTPQIIIYQYECTQRGFFTHMGTNFDDEQLENEFIIMRNSAGVNSHFFIPGPYHPEHESTCMEFISWYLKALSMVQLS